MTNKEQLLKDLEEMKARVASMEAELNKPDIEPFWEPKEGEKAWYITSRGETALNTIWRESDMINQGNVFQTEAEAIKERDLRACKQRLKKAVWKANGGKFIEFALGNKSWAIDLNIKMEKLAKGTWSESKVYDNWQYLVSKEVAEKVLASHHDDWLMLRNA